MDGGAFEVLISVLGKWLILWPMKILHPGVRDFAYR